MKCRRCSGPAAIEIRRHNSAFCKDCFLVVFRAQVERAIHHYDMFAQRDRILVAVSGGKDSLALWDVLLDLGYDATGLYLGLGIGGYSTRSGDVTRKFAADRGAELAVVDLQKDYGYDIPTAGRKGSRSTCAVCGLSKRYIFNRAALEGGFDVIATGHNLDDEAATLLGNTLRWNTEYIARQSPLLPSKDGMVKKVKPLFRLSELETAAFAFLRGIDYIVEECPLVGGNTQLRYKNAMNTIESTSPGTKAQFFLGYLERGAPLFASADDAELVPCEKCAQPTTGRFCAFCRARSQILGERLGGAPSAGEIEGAVAGSEDREVARELAEEVLPVEIYGNAAADA
ncbi:MAG: adenine nucleotide alpha hydrolase family protein [Actinomycetota bacterium]|nr:adenine nucleotide alpha hydrolase family protein [Actinomycetota bacterium]